jgi:uncharacterized protein (UPF0332 family)
MNDEQRALVKNAKESLRIARIIAQEHAFGFAISRAYYTMFYIACAMLIKVGQRYSSHSAVVAMFGKFFAKTGVVRADYHRFLIDAQFDRTTGDYDPLASLTQADADKHIAHAEEFIEMGVAFLAAPPPPSDPKPTDAP